MKIGLKFFVFLVSAMMFICSIQVIHAEDSMYSHSDSATSGDLTLKVEWNDQILGQPTTFHVSATGGSGIYKFNMEAPSYTNPDVMVYESVADPSRGEWTKYSDECTSQDYTFTMMASGTYNFRFHVMDIKAGVTYLRTNTYIQVSSSDYPSVNSLIQSAVTQCNNDTDGSDYQKALWLHDWLLNQLEYDNSLKWSSAESALTRGLGTCQAYERAYAQLLSAAGIENAETRDTYDGHTWNAMKLDGEWYQVDCTWDDSNDNWYNFDQRRLYFGLTDELMAVAHPGYSNIYTVNGYSTRSTTLKNNYFVKSGEAQKWVELYRDRIQNSLDSKQTQFSIQADNSTYPPSIYIIQNGIIAYVMNQNAWFVNGKKINLIANVNDNKFDFNVTYPIECTEHDWDEGKVTTEPTCTKEGIKMYTCKNCATTRTETIKALGHDYSNEWTIDKPATCTEEGNKSHHCTRCDDKKDVTIIPKIEHNWNSGVVTTKAICMKDGVKTYTCKDCKTAKTEVIKALGHDYSSDWTIDKKATCTEEGNKSHHCTRCDDKKDVTIIPKIEHNWNSGVVTTKAICMKDGVKTYTCKDCKTAKTEVIKALGHDYSSDWTIDKKATCTEEGSKSHHCTRCDDKKDVTTISKTNHNWDSGVVTKKATCTQSGVRTYTCKYCKTTKTEVIKALGHDYSLEWTIDKAATCTQEGSKSHHCTRCDEKMDVARIEKLNHSWKLTSTIESTKDKEGKNIYTCSLCNEKREEVIAKLIGKWITNNNGKWFGYPDGTYENTGFKKINEDTYYFQSNGYVKTGWLLDNGVWYYFNKDGIMQTGWSGPGRQYYFDDAGKMLEKQFTPDGYYVGSSGAYVRNGWVLNNGKYYYMNSAGKIVKCSWVGSYYLGSDGVMVTNKWVQWNEKYYYLDSQGVYVNNKWIGSYYLDSNGAMATNRWVGNYWCGSDGQYVKSSWVDNNRYYVNNKGLYVVGSWQKDSVGWYYRVGNDYAKNITLNINGSAYKFDSRGYWVS